MEGLEISEINLKEILKTELLRLEAEFYTSSSFKLDNFVFGKDMIDFVQYGTSKGLNEEGEGYPILRLNEFDSSFISTPSKYCDIIDKKTFNSLKLKKNDVLICRTNGNAKYVGKSAIVPKDYEFAYASYLFKIRPNKEIINASTLVSFLNGKYGRIEIEKYSMASNQVNFSPAKFRQLRIPNLNQKINNRIEQATFQSFEYLSKSQSLYQSAETLLLQEIGLEDFEPSKEGINVKSLKDSFLSSGRLDAEYYQPKYDEIEKAIINYKYGYSELKNFIRSFSTGYPYKSDSYVENGGIPLIRINNINKGNLDISNAIHIPLSDENLSIKDIAIENDILISMSGTIGNSCKVPKGIKAVINQRIMKITSKNFDSEVLPLIINSSIGEMQLNRIGTGGVQTNISSNDIKKILIPNLSNETQTQIAELVERSFSLKQKSEQLLESAKKAVEMAIEQDEEIALEWIEKQLIDLEE